MKTHLLLLCPLFFQPAKLNNFLQLNYLSGRVADHLGEGKALKKYT